MLPWNLWTQGQSFNFEKVRRSWTYKTSKWKQFSRSLAIFGVARYDLCASIYILNTNEYFILAMFYVSVVFLSLRKTIFEKEGSAAANIFEFEEKWESSDRQPAYTKISKIHLVFRNWIFLQCRFRIWEEEFREQQKFHISKHVLEPYISETKSWTDLCIYKRDYKIESKQMRQTVSEFWDPYDGFMKLLACNMQLNNTEWIHWRAISGFFDRAVSWTQIGVKNI